MSLSRGKTPFRRLPPGVGDPAVAGDARERDVAGNGWAFRHWLRLTGGPDLVDSAAVHRFATTEPARFGASLAAFARLPADGTRLVRRAGAREALVLRGTDGTRQAWARDALRAAMPATLPPEIAAPLARTWSLASLVEPLADLLLVADLRPDDRVLVAERSVWPGLAALLAGATVIVANELLHEEHPTLLIGF